MFSKGRQDTKCPAHFSNKNMKKKIIRLYVTPVPLGEYAAVVTLARRVSREGAGQPPALLLEEGLATFKLPRNQRRRTGSAPSKAATDARTRPPLVRCCALLPRDLPLLACIHIRGARRAYCACGGERGAYRSSSECSRSSAGRKLPPHACGRAPGAG